MGVRQRGSGRRIRLPRAVVVVELPSPKACLALACLPSLIQLGLFGFHGFGAFTDFALVQNDFELFGELGEKEQDFQSCSFSPKNG